MRHLMAYNESAGTGWREVSLEEMERLMDGQSIDTFTMAEAQHLFDLLSSGAIPKRVKMYEDRYTVSHMMRDMARLFGDTNRRLLRITDTLFTHDNPHPRTMANCLRFAYEGPAGGWGHIKVHRSPDDYIYVRMDQNSKTAHYVCDGFVALKALISEKAVGPAVPSQPERRRLS